MRTTDYDAIRAAIVQASRTFAIAGRLAGVSVAPAGEFRILGDLAVHRFGFGAMRLTGLGVWGPPHDIPAARAVLRRAVELGIDFIDTADVYGPGDNERLIRDTLAPFPASLVVATKGGVTRTGPATPQQPNMGVDNSEAHLRAAVEGSLRDLGVERIDLYQLHRIDPAVPLTTTLGVLARLRDEGKLRHIGLSEATVEQLALARTVLPVATVQNEYNLATRRHDAVLDYCTANGIGFIPFYPLRTGAHQPTVAAIAEREGVAPSAVALAWLLARSPAIITISGTTSVQHLEANVAACRVRLSTADLAALAALPIS